MLFVAGLPCEFADGVLHVMPESSIKLMGSAKFLLSVSTWPTFVRYLTIQEILCTSKVESECFINKAVL